MIRLTSILLIVFSTFLASCTPTQSETGAFSTPSVERTPDVITSQPPSQTPSLTPLPTTTPTQSGGLSPAELKYRILSTYPDFFYCDPDEYPVARGDEAELARQRFPELKADTEEFNAILAYNNLEGKSTFTDDEKLLIYREHKKLTAIQLVRMDDSYRFKIQVARSEGEGELITGLIDSQGSITVLQKEASIATCPICLAAGTLIDTPAGPLPVESLHTGMLVWTIGAGGIREARPVSQISRTVVPADHQVVHLVLDDGRELWVSPGHPTAEGLTAGELQVGDRLSGGTVLSKSRERYTGIATYDLLPGGETGQYWANGILLASTLHPSEMDEIVAEGLLHTGQIRANVELDEWGIMPNHMHAILIINNVETPRRGVSTFLLDKRLM